MHQPSDRRDALPAGTSLHSYQILRVLGSGAFGITYLVEHNLLHTQHVIKEYLPDSAMREGVSTVCPKSQNEQDLFDWGLRSFFDEARLLHKLSHRNIVKVTDLFEANGTAYFVMPYLEGKTLHEWMKLHPNAQQEQLETIFVPLLEGLKYIHERELLHRDIKPENIYICSDGNPVLIDFGAARIAIGQKSKALTQVLTPCFAPWEQYASKGIFTPALDLYSLAGCMYQAITGQLPEEAPNRLQDDPQPKLAGSRYEKHYAPHFLQAIDKTINIWARDRYQNGFDMQKALMGYDASNKPVTCEAGQENKPERLQTTTTGYTYTRSPKRLTSILIIMLWFSVVFEVFAVLGNMAQISLLSGEFTQVQAEANDLRQEMITLGQLFVFVVTSVAFLMWVYRANLNCRGFGIRDMRFNPGWSVGWHFIPLFNFFRPYQIMKEIWQISHKAGSDLEPSHTLLKWWWALWLSSGMIEIVASLQNTSSVEGLLFGSLWSLLIALLCLVLYLVVLKMIKTIANQQLKAVSNQ